MGYFEQGKLYGGDPYCFQGPVTYIVTEIFTTIFSQYGLYILYFFCFSLITFILYLINQKETGGLANVFLCFISLFVFAKIIWYDTATIIAMIFLMSGFYILYYSSLSKKELLCGFLLTLAMFSKTQIFFVVIPIVMFYLYSLYAQTAGQSHIEKIKLYWKNQRKKICFLIIPFVSVFVILLLWMPGFVFYNYIVHTYNPTVQSYFSILKELITFKYYYNGYFLILYLGIFISFCRLVFYKKFDVYSCISSICLGIMMIGVASKFSLFRLIDQYRYFLPFAPFYFINLLKFGKEFKEKNTKKQWILILFICILLLGVFYNTLSGLTFQDFIQNKGINEQKTIDRLKSELEAPLFALPKGQILIVNNIYHMYDQIFDENPFAALNESDFIPLVMYNENESLNPDMAVANNFVAAGVLPSLNPYMHISIIPWEDHFNKWINGNYTIIISYNYELHLKIFLAALKESNMTLSQQYCIFKLPAYMEGIETNTDLFMYMFMYNNNNACDIMKQYIENYYTQNADHFCERGKQFVDIVNNALIFENIQIDSKCTHTSSLILLNNMWKFQALYLCILLTGFLVYIVLSSRNIKVKI